MKNKLNFCLNIVKQLIADIGDNRIMKKSASLTYYTIFSLSPLLLILISGASMFFKKDAVENKLYDELKNFLGSDVALAIQNFVENSTISGESSLALYIGIGILLFGASTMFADMQDSLNLIYGVELISKQAWLVFIINRGFSFLTIFILGLLLVATVILNSVLIGFGENVLSFFKINTELSTNTLVLLNGVLSFLVSMLIFYVLFKVLPDAKIKHHAALIGAFFTALLFLLAKYFIGIYISNSNYLTIFGSAGSLVILLLWIYYVSTIIFIGANFTKIYAQATGFPLIPVKDAKLRKVEFD